mgnify:CR=1 FL=1
MEAAMQKLDVAAMASKYMKENKLSNDDFAKKINFARPTLVQYLGGKYASNPVNIENAILEFFKTEGLLEQEPPRKEESVPVAKAPVKRSGFLASRDAREILARCQACQEEKGLGLIIGRPGHGKTFMLNHYAKADRVCYIVCNSSMTRRDLVKAMERSMGLPRGSGSVDDRIDLIKDFFRVNSGYLIIVDEADKLVNNDTVSKLETLQTIFDIGNVGILVAGEPRLKKLIKNYHPMFANRIEFFLELKGLLQDEVEEYLEDYRFTPEAMKEMVYRATNDNTGCFRLLDRTFKNVKRLVGPEEEITLDIINKASSMMLL